ncbi:hypothetical protein [Nonomuraea sp. NPDC050783]
MRVVLVPAGSGLSNVRCGVTLAELQEHLEEEARRGCQAVAPPSIT